MTLETKEMTTQRERKKMITDDANIVAEAIAQNLKEDPRGMFGAFVEAGMELVELEESGMADEMEVAYEEYLKLSLIHIS